jgi:aerobic-type carbon monoxide dehydrogenase small subunit (CoxS/CutS family)
MQGEGLRLHSGITRGPAFQIQLDGQAVPAYPGETLATALWAAGHRALRRTALTGEPRGMYCGMGICFECLVTVNGHLNMRSCLTLARPGDVVERQG